MEIVFYLVIIALTFLFQLTKRLSRKKEMAENKAKPKTQTPLASKSKPRAQENVEIENIAENTNDSNKWLESVFNKMDVFYEREGEKNKKTNRGAQNNVAQAESPAKKQEERGRGAFQVSRSPLPSSSQHSPSSRFSYDDAVEQQDAPSFLTPQESAQEKAPSRQTYEQRKKTAFAKTNDSKREVYGNGNAYSAKKLQNALRNKNSQRKAVLLAEILNAPIALRGKGNSFPS